MEPSDFNPSSGISSGTSKLLAAALSVAKEEPGPKAEATKAGPGREYGAGSAVASTMGSKLGGKWTRAKQVTNLDGKPPESQQMDWGKPLNDVLRLVKEERVIQARLDKYSFYYNDIWAARERVRSSKSLSDVNVLQRDKKRVVARLRKLKRGLLNPNSTTMQVLDLLTLLALGFTVLVTPYEVGLILNPIAALDYANYVVNVIFFLGIITQFFLPYHEKAQEGGRLVRSHSRIAKRYVLGSFFVDVVSTVPFSDLAPLLMSGEQSSKELQLLRMLRAVRLLKLGRIFRASRILVRMADLLEQWFDFSVSFAARTLIFWTVAILLLFHWFVCFWCLLAGFMGTQRTEVLELARLADGTCERGHGDCLSVCEQELLGTMMAKSVEVVNQAEVWWCHAIASGAIPPEAVGPQHFELYLFVLGHAELEHMVIPSNRAEYATNFVCQFIMLIVSNIFVGVVANAQSEADPLGKAHKARLDHLNHLLDSVRAPQDLKRRTREYLQCTKDLVAMQGFTDLYDLFSPKLRGDLIGFISNQLLKNVPFFESCEPGFMRELSLKLSHVGYEAGDRVKLAEPTLCIVSRGTAVLGGKPISINQFWGEDMIVTSKALRDNRIAIALTYIEIVTLSRSDLFELMESWDESAKLIRIAALKISMIRAPQIITNYLKQKAIERRGGGDLTPRMLVDEAIRLETALKNIGPSSKFEHREYHEVMKRINGALPLRGFAVEQRFSADAHVASLAVAALNVAGDDGKLLLDEAGQVVNRSGETVKVMGETEDVWSKEFMALRLELRADFKEVYRQQNEIRREIALLTKARFGAPSIASDAIEPIADRAPRAERTPGAERTERAPNAVVRRNDSMPRTIRRRQRCGTGVNDSQPGREPAADLSA